ncbi:MAG: type II toxin-antitoxin system RelE/ParE family toxin [Rhodospirillales bacterium]|nr:type II toxin-antitoxin system RelE/ParE family toxin [Rhodospirillales bacterium]
MRIVLSARVEADIANQLQHSIDHFGTAVAERTFARLDTFLFKFLADYPLAGRPIEGIYEAWVARTPFVVFYRVEPDKDIVTVLALFHHAQDRAGFDPND